VKNYTINSANLTGSGSLKGFGWSNQLGASGPWPHARYVADRDTQVQTLNSNVFLLDLSAASDPSKGSRIQAADTTGILDDDLVGNVAKGGTFCLDLIPGGMLEVWAGPLTGGRIAVALFNRSPTMGTVVAQWGSIGARDGVKYTAMDVWTGNDLGVFEGSFSAEVAPRNVQYAILSPVA